MSSTCRFFSSSAYRLLVPGLLLGAQLVAAQGGKDDAGPKVALSVHTDVPEAVYHCGETATFTIAVTHDDKPAAGSVSVNLTFDGGKQLHSATLPLTAGKASVSWSLETPGFILCTASHTAEGKRSVALGGAAFDPTGIKASTLTPPDFDEFWNNGRKMLAELPLDLRLRKLENHSDENQDSYAISFANVWDTRVYGFLSVPKKQQPPYPAWVTVPGAGPGPYGPSGKHHAAAGALALTVGVHTYDVGTLSKDEIQAAYKELNSGGTYSHHGAPDRDRYFFRRAILGIDRAITWLAQRDDFNGKQMVIDGSSQGGAMSLILAGFNPHITAAAANVPAMCDHTAYWQERAPGWPKIVPVANEETRDAYARMSAYFDAVNFARRITCPVILSAGFIDRTCPPGSVYSAYNEIRTPKKMYHGPLDGHTTNVGEYRRSSAIWVREQLGLTPVQ